MTAAPQTKVDWDKVFPSKPLDRKLRLHMGKVLTTTDLCVLLRREPTAENRGDLITDLYRLAEGGKVLRFWVGEGPAAEVGFAALQPEEKDEETGEPLPVYVHDSGRPVTPYA